MSDTNLTGERADLQQALGAAHHFLTFTAKGLTDEQAAATPTVSALCVGGTIKHVAWVQDRWLSFMLGDPGPMSSGGFEQHTNSFRMLDGETLAGILERYAEVHARTLEALRTLPDLDVSYPLPEAPWFPPGARWSARRVLLHIVAETTHHAGHADIIRETIDGQKTMG